MWLSTGTGRVLSISSFSRHASRLDVLRCTEMFFLCSQFFIGYGCKFSSHKLGDFLSVGLKESDTEELTLDVFFGALTFVQRDLQPAHPSPKFA